MKNLDEKILKVIREQEEYLANKQGKDEKIAHFLKNIGTNKEVEQKFFYGGTFKIYFPKYMAKMSDEHVKIKYPNENRPALLYSNDTDSINIGITVIDDDSFLQEEVSEFRDIMLEGFLSVNPHSKIIEKDEIQSLISEESSDTRPYMAYYSFDSLAIGGGMYNFVFLFLVNKALVIVSLNSSIKDMEQNEILFNGIMRTTKIIGNSAR